jgi:hypothetical protein
MKAVLMSERIKMSDTPAASVMRWSAAAADWVNSMVKRPARRSCRNCCRNRASTLPGVLCAFDLIELDGEDLRREPIETRERADRGSQSLAILETTPYKVVFGCASCGFAFQF